jgi:hypothetical protein
MERQLITSKIWFQDEIIHDILGRLEMASSTSWAFFGIQRPAISVSSTTLLAKQQKTAS